MCEIYLNEYFKGEFKLENYFVVEVDLLELGEGEVQVKNFYIFVDLYMCGWMSGIKIYIEFFQIGVVMEGGVVGEVVVFNFEGLKLGDYVMLMFGWCEVYIKLGKMLMKIDIFILLFQVYLGIVGLIGMIVYVGLKCMIDLKLGEILWMFVGVGVVGFVGIQFVKVMGVMVIVMVCGQEKVDYFKFIGVDYVIDYIVMDNLVVLICEVVLVGVDVYFENVGGIYFMVVFEVFKQYGCMVVCGMIQCYNDVEQVLIIDNFIYIVGKLFNICGFIVFDYMDMQGEFVKDFIEWMMVGKINLAEIILDGIDKVLEVFIGFFFGVNKGKMLVKIQ